MWIDKRPVHICPHLSTSVRSWAHSVTLRSRESVHVIESSCVPYRVSSFCSFGNCVEVGVSSDAVFVRDTKDPGRRALSFTDEEWVAFVAGVKAGEFDLS